MNNLTEFIKHLEDLINQICKIETDIPFGNLTKLENDLKRELDKAIQIKTQNRADYKYEYFSEEVLHSKSPNGEMYEYLGSRFADIKSTQLIITKLISPEIRSKQMAMKTEFDKLRTEANSKLPELGYSLNKEDKFSSEFIKGNGLKVKIVDQRYDPPECWISQNENQQFTRIGFISEYYFDKNLKLMKKYNISNLGFDYGSIEYYMEFLGEYENQLLEMGDFVDTINQWSKNNYQQISEIRNAI
mgnify:CR=1 FL=1